MDNDTTYRDNRQYFKLKEYILPKSKGGSRLPPGLQRFNFQLVIPPGNFPSSFKGSKGQITYTFEVKISRSWRVPTNIQRELKFLSKSLANQLQSPYSGSLCKDFGLFRSTRKVQLFVTVNKNIYSPGETAEVTVKIMNQSSKNMRPKIKFQQRIEYRAGSSSTDSQHSWYKLVGDTINGNSEGTFNCQVRIPADIIPTIHNCEIISVEYYLKVYLDITFAFDPELQLPLIIVPSRLANLYLAEAVGAPTYSEFPPSVPSSFNGYPTPHLTQAAPSGLPSSEHQARLTASGVGAEEQTPPSYESLWPSDNNHDCTGSNKKKDKLKRINHFSDHLTLH